MAGAYPDLEFVMTHVVSHAPASVLAILAQPAPAYAVLLAHVDAVVAAHRDRQEKLLSDSQAILAMAEAEKRELTDEETRQVDDLSSEFEKLEREIASRNRVAAQRSLLNAPNGRQTLPDEADRTEIGNAAAPVKPARAPSPSVYPEPKVGNGTFGFRSFGDFALAVKNGNPKFGRETDGRLLQNATASTYANEGTGADGGFLVPPDFRQAILSRAFSEQSLVGRTTRMTASGNSITIPADNTTPWQTSGGVQVYWTGEGAAITQSKPQLENITIRTHKLAALVPVTEEIMDDAPALDGWLRMKVPAKIDFEISNQIIWGNGAGKPLGYMNSPSLVSQAAESGQAATTVNATNLFKMYARMPSSNRGNAIWIMHPDVEPQLLGLVAPGATFPAYMPPGGLSASPYGTLFGRPVVTHQAAKSLGTLGDVMFVDLNEYMTLTKTNGTRQDVSVHLWFDQDITAFKFTIRIGGQPSFSAPLSQLNGSNTQSAFVTLAAR